MALWPIFLSYHTFYLIAICNFFFTVWKNYNPDKHAETFGCDEIFVPKLTCSWLFPMMFQNTSLVSLYFRTCVICSTSFFFSWLWHCVQFLVFHSLSSPYSQWACIVLWALFCFTLWPLLLNPVAHISPSFTFLFVPGQSQKSESTHYCFLVECGWCCISCSELIDGLYWPRRRRRLYAECISVGGWALWTQGELVQPHIPGTCGHPLCVAAPYTV